MCPAERPVLLRKWKQEKRTARLAENIEPDTPSQVDQRGIANCRSLPVENREP